MPFMRFSPFLSIVLFVLFGASSVEAKTTKIAAAPTPAPAVANGSQRTETTTYHSWTVTCHEIVGSASKKTCSAILRVIDKGGHPLMAWIIGLDHDGKLTSVIRIPTGVTVTDKSSGAKATGLMVNDGIDLELGKAAVHLNYLLCEPQWCEASASMDGRFVKDALAAANAVVTIHAAGGSAIRYPALPLKGIDEAVLMVRR